MKYNILTILATFSSLVSSQTTIIATQTPNASQASKIQSGINSYISDLTTQSQFSSFISAVAETFATGTVEPTTATFYDLDISNWGLIVTAINSQIVAPAPSGYPSDMISYVQSIDQAEASIINSVMSGSAPSESAKQGLLLCGLFAAGTVVAAALL